MSMIAALQESVSELFRRVTCIIGRGRLTLCDDTGVIQQLQLTMNYNELIGPLLHMGEYGFVSSPPKGSDILAVFLSGDRSNGAAIGSNHQTYRMRGLAEGESAMHDNLGKYVYLSAAGIVINAGGQPVTVNGATTVTINAATGVIMETPYLKVSGDIIDNYHTNTESSANLRSIYNSHTHNDPQGGVTGPPNQLE